MEISDTISRYSGRNSGPGTTVVTDRHGRRVRMRAADPRPPDAEALAEMYATFGADDRAQGLPPRDDAGIREWLARLDGVHVVAAHGSAAVGHAVLAPYESADAELAIFVRPSHQGAGIGTHLLGELLDRGADAGVADVWLHVERSNEAAIALYRKYGFAVADESPMGLEMRLRLADVV
jgi:GNAT superfamily N-acetyltransferase